MQSPCPFWPTFRLCHNCSAGCALVKYSNLVFICVSVLFSRVVTHTEIDDIQVSTRRVYRRLSLSWSSQVIRAHALTEIKISSEIRSTTCEGYNYQSFSSHFFQSPASLKKLILEKCMCNSSVSKAEGEHSLCSAAQLACIHDFCLC